MPDTVPQYSSETSYYTASDESEYGPSSSSKYDSGSSSGDYSSSDSYSPSESYSSSGSESYSSSSDSYSSSSDSYSGSDGYSSSSSDSYSSSGSSAVYEEEVIPEYVNDQSYGNGGSGTYDVATEEMEVDGGVYRPIITSSSSSSVPAGWEDGLPSSGGSSSGPAYMPPSELNSQSGCKTFRACTAKDQKWR